MDPGLEGAVEELKPLIPYMEYQRLAQEKMLEPKTRCNASKVKQVSAKQQTIKA